MKSWYILSTQNIGNLVVLLDQEMSASEADSKTLFNALNIYKAGFYSEDKEVSRLTSEFFSQLIVEVNENGGELVGETWEWFARPSPGGVKHEEETKEPLKRPKRL